MLLLSISMHLCCLGEETTEEEPVSPSEMKFLLAKGDGEVGENVTANVRMIADVPRRVAAGPLEVRGEDAAAADDADAYHAMNLVRS